MFTGLSAFPITPFKDEQIDFSALQKLISNLVEAQVESICAIGSTGLYPYLSLEEKQQICSQVVEMASGTPVMAGIGALRTKDVLRNADALQKVGVSAVLLAPVSYHRLSEDEVFSLFKAVTAELSVPLCVYENPGVTNFTFSDELYAQIAQLPNVAAIKIPGSPFADNTGKERLHQLRNILPESIAIGVSGDMFGAAGMAAGCDLWLSVIGGLFPNTVKRLISLAQSPEKEQALQASNSMSELWQQFTQHRGGLRVVATAAGILGFAEQNCLPRPLKTLQGEDRIKLEKILSALSLN